MSEARILLVEDEPVAAELLGFQLVKLGYTVAAVVTTGEEALQRGAAVQPDVVLMDIHLAGELDGIQTAELLRGQVDAPVIYMTAHADGTTLERAKVTSPFGYIVKPCQPAELHAAVEIALYRHQVEKRLRESEERYHRLVDTAQEGIWAVDADYRVTFVNPRGAAMLGYRADEIIGQPLTAFFHADDLHDHEMQIAARRAGSRARFERRFLRKDGSVCWTVVSAVPQVDSEGAFTGSFSMCTDITDRKLAEQAVVDSQSKYQALVENTPDVIMRFDRECRHVFANRAATELTGIAPEAFLGKTHRELGFPEEMCDYWEEHIGRVFDTGEADQEEFVLETPTRRVAFDWRLTPELDAEGRVHTVLSASRDITEQRHLEEALQQAVKMEAVGRLAGGVAHDFNNLLTPIIGYSEMILRRMPLHDPLRQHVTEIARMGERAATLTRQLLAFSRKQVLEPKVISLNDVVSDLQKMLRRLIGEDVYLSFIPGEGTGKVRADPGQMEQVIVNLVVNARDAMPDGGALTIETRHLQIAAGESRGSDLSPGRYVELLVADTGHGMDAQTLAHIFEPFFTTKERGKGTGLGLATVYGIVSQSGGHITVESAPQQGSSFHVILPCADQEDGCPTVQAPAAPPGGGSETILLVEDDPDVRLVAQAILESYGYRVLVASGGVQAMEISAGLAGDIDLLVTDVVMPGMTGVTLAETLCSWRPGLRVLCMSGYTDEGIVRHGVLDRGMAYFRKPFTPRELTQKVREVLDGEAAPQPPADAASALPSC